MNPTDAFKAELEMRTREYDLAIERGIGLLNAAKDRVSTHLGHNLANVATDLSVIAGKVEAAKSALMFFEQEAAK